MATTDRRGVSVDATDTPISGNPNPGLAIKAPALVATNGNITLSGVQAIDGVTVGNSNERVLVWQQTDATTNGLYNASSGPWTRTIDMQSNDQVADGMLLIVTHGSTFFSTQFQLTSADPVAIGTSAISFVSNKIGGLTPVDNALLVTSSLGIPLYSTAIPNGVTATTQAANDDTTKVATTAYVFGNYGGLATANSWAAAQTISDTTASTSPTTGALKVAGGVGVAGALFVGGSASFSGGLATSGGVAPNFEAVVGAGAPATSGTTDSSRSLAVGNGTVGLRFGVYGSGAFWLQPSLISNLSTNFSFVLNPNGGNICIGGQANSPGTPYVSAPGATLLTVGGPIATSVSSTKTANYAQTSTDSSLIFNGAGSLTLTLLSAASVPGQWLYVKTVAAQTVVSASSNIIPLIGGAAGTAILAGTAGKWAWLQSDGANWVVMAAN